MQNIGRCLIILLIHNFSEWYFILILSFYKLHLIYKICKASTLLVTNTCSSICFKWLLNYIRILFQRWLRYLLDLIKCIHMTTKSISFLSSHLTILSFDRILSSISWYCRIILIKFISHLNYLSCQYNIPKILKIK